MKYLPARYRPKKDIRSMVNDIHMSARLMGALKDEMADKEAEVEPFDIAMQLLLLPKLKI